MGYRKPRESRSTKQQRLPLHECRRSRMSLHVAPTHTVSSLHFFLSIRGDVSK